MIFFKLLVFFSLWEPIFFQLFMSQVAVEAPSQYISVCLGSCLVFYLRQSVSHSSPCYPSVPPVMVLKPEYLFFFLLDHKFHVNSPFSLLFCLWNVLPALVALAWGRHQGFNVIKNKAMSLPNLKQEPRGLQFSSKFFFSPNSDLPVYNHYFLHKGLLMGGAEDLCSHCSCQEPHYSIQYLLSHMAQMSRLVFPHRQGQFLSMSLFHCSITRDAGSEFDNVKNSNFLTFHIVFFLSVPISWFYSVLFCCFFFERLQLN